jgi:hypothetical protein
LGQEIQHIRLNVVQDVPFGGCAELRSDVKCCLMREAGNNPPHIGFVPGLPSYWPRSREKKGLPEKEQGGMW